MKTNKHEPGAPDKGLRVIVVEGAAERRRFDGLLDAEHDLGARRPAGNTLRQAVVDERGEWVAALLWCGACYRLGPRDSHIGWDAAKREARNALVVQNSRFLVVARTREPNMASRAMGAALRALPGQFEAKYGYAPALAESFTDPELHAGTSYRATGWEKRGLTKGNSRDYLDFYVPNGRPKVLWTRPLRADWREALCAPEPLGRDAAALRPTRALPIREAEVGSLFEALMRVPDPRRNNRHICLASVLTLVVLALLCGRRDISAIHRFGQALTPGQKKLLGFPRLRANRSLCKAPSYKAIYSVLRAVSHTALADALDAWFAASLGGLPESLAMDGKYVRDLAGTLNLCASDGRTASSRPIKKKARRRPAGAPPSGASAASTA
jgi:hypothetical protein